MTVCALMIAYFIGRTLVVPLPRSYQLDFGDAQWIESPGGSQSGYFRKTLYLPGRVDRAWVEVTASDNYDLYVNTLRFEERWLVKARPANVYEIAAFLHPGKNVIAIHSNRISFPGAAQIKVRGFYALPDSPLQEFVSDTSWRASGTPDGIVGSFQWVDPGLDDTFWSFARTGSSGERYSTVQSIRFDPRLLQSRPAGKWIAPPQLTGREAAFAYHLKLKNWLPQQVWMAVAATGPYDILVNGKLAFTQPVDLQSLQLALATSETAASVGFSSRNAENGPLSETPDLSAIEPPVTAAVNRLAGKQLLAPAVPHANEAPRSVFPTMPQPPTAPTTASSRQLEAVYPFTTLEQPATLPANPPPPAPPVHATPVSIVYDISSWIKRGDNLIICRVQAESGQAALLSEVVRNLPNGQFLRIGSGPDWQILNGSPGGTQPINARVVGQYGDPPWGVLPQAASKNPPWAPSQDLREIRLWAVTLGATLSVIFLLWITMPMLAAKISGRSRAQHWNADALSHLVVLGPALLLLVLSCDVRFDPDWCYTPSITAGLILLFALVKLIVFLFSLRRDSSAQIAEPQPLPTKSRYARYWKVAVVLGLIIFGAYLRAPNLTAVSLDVDEFGVMQYSDGVLAAGYPFIKLGSFRKVATTYELTSYSIAAVRSIFGTSEASLRYHSLFFGILMVGLVAWVGYRIVDWRVGVVSAAIYTCLPTAVWWSRNGFYPSQEQFLALLTIWTFYEAIRTRPIRRGYMTAASIAFIVTYLSWEGSGFLIPAMFVCMFAMKWGEYDWISDWHLWRCFFVVSCIVVLQLIHRQFASMPSYLQIGVSLADVSTPQLVYLDPTTYDPGFYITNCLLQENFFLMTLVIFGGIAFCWKDRGIRYLFVMFFALFTCYTEFLPAYTIRYSTNYHSLIVLISVAICFRFWDRVKALNIPQRMWSVRALRWETPAFLVLVLLISANGYFLQTYRLSINPDVPIVGGRIGVYKTDYRGAALFAAHAWSPGDALIVTIPHVFEFYARRDVDYSTCTMMGKVLTYDGGRGTPIFFDKFRGLPSIRSLEEVEDLRSRYRRLWFVQVPVDDPLDPLSSAYLRAKGRVVYQSYKARVVLVDGTKSSVLDIKQKEREPSRPSWRVTSD
ncbi:MAG TPA: glycosyltransferase family 39 protein [Candidatus Binataceae bacterium]|nr:glycosyltransferase family 39 protein [Candidatus Binataceae bacterium]